MSFGITAGTALLAGSALGAGATMYASNKASKAQGRASRQAIEADQWGNQKARQDQAPWMAAGGQSLNRLAGMLGIDAGPNYSEGNFNVAKYLAANPDAQEYMRTSGRSAYDHFIADGSRRTGDFWNVDPNANRAGSADFGSLNRDFSMADFEKDPGYQFRMDEGNKAITNSATARGGVLSGAAAKALTRFNQDYASGEFTNSFNRFQTNRANKFNSLASLANVGQTTATQLGNQSIATGQSIGNNLIGAGNARASGYMGMANALNGGIGQAFNMYQNNELMKRFPMQG